MRKLVSSSSAVEVLILLSAHELCLPTLPSGKTLRKPMVSCFLSYARLAPFLK